MCICFVWFSSCMIIRHSTCQSGVRWGLDQTVLEEGHVSRPPLKGRQHPRESGAGNGGNRCVFLIVAHTAHISPILSDANDGRDVTCWGTGRQKEWLLVFADCLERLFINRNPTQLLEYSLRMIILEIELLWWFTSVFWFIITLHGPTDFCLIAAKRKQSTLLYPIHCSVQCSPLTFTANAFVL